VASPLKSQQLTGVAGIDASQLQAFGRALDKAAPELRIEMQRRLKAAAEVIKLDAMERASEHSTTIAHTIRLTSNRSAVTISAGGKGNVLARLYEIGNLEKGRKRNRRRRSSTATGASGELIFRHPGRPRADGSASAWADQARYPFLAPALEAHRTELAEGVQHAVADIMQRISVDRSGAISVLGGL